MATAPNAGNVTAPAGQADQSTTEIPAVVPPQDYVPFTTHVRKFFGVHTDRDVQEASNLVMRLGGSLVVAAVNPVAGAAALAYTVGATVRDDAQGKLIDAAKAKAQAENPSV